MDFDVSHKNILFDQRFLLMRFQYLNNGFEIHTAL